MVLFANNGTSGTGWRCLCGSNQDFAGIGDKNMAKPILSAELAQSFLVRLGEHIDQNINIMNQEGIIIASRDPSRIGTYHDRAHRLILANSEVEEITESAITAPGVKPGVNLPIKYKGETIGVVGVTGRPSEVRSLAYAVKISLETFVELETLRDRMLHQQAGMNRLIAKLLNPESQDELSLHELALRIGYDPVLPRTPLLIALNPSSDPEAALRTIKSHGLRNKQNILALTNQGSILLCIASDKSRTFNLKIWEQGMKDFCNTLQNLLPGSRFYIGMVQGDISRYHLVYKQLLWLRRNYETLSHSLFMVHQHLMQLLTDSTIRVELESLFEYTRGAIAYKTGGTLPQWFPETLFALVRSDFSIQHGAEMLHLYRNSLAGRIRKMDEILGLDILTETGWRDYLRVFAYYLTQTVHDAQ